MKNPYTESHEEPKLLNSFVCFADILGFSQLSIVALKNGNGNSFLSNIRKALTTTYQRVDRHAQGLGDEAYFSYKVFTDNIVVGYPLRDEKYDYGEPEFANILDTFIEFQLGLVLEGFLVRGGLAYGSHYMDDDIVFGDALLDAVSLDKSGSPPRIALTKSAIELLKGQLSFYSSKEGSPQYEFLLQDSDGTIFLNYLSEAFMAFPDGGILFEVIEDHKQSITNGLKENIHNPGVRSKFEWVARYHNFVCQEFCDRHPIPTTPDADEIFAAACVEAQKLIDYKIDISAFSTNPSRIKSI
ncbi:MAG: hypothetical protein WD607_02765 [Candidatus Paceibacterota bacterium]